MRVLEGGEEGMRVLEGGEEGMRVLEGGEEGMRVMEGGEEGMRVLERWEGRVGVLGEVKYQDCGEGGDISKVHILYLGVRDECFGFHCKIKMIL